MPIILRDIRLSNDIFEFDSIECTSGINGFVNVTKEDQVPFVTLEFYNSETNQRAIRRYFMIKNVITGKYDHWSGKSPCELMIFKSKSLPAVFETRNGITICLFNYEVDNKLLVDRIFDRESKIKFDIYENKIDTISNSFQSNYTQDIEQSMIESKREISNANEKKQNSNTVNLLTSEKPENKNLFGGVIAVIIFIIVILFIFSLVGGALNGMADVLSEIPKWLRIVLFVSISLFAAGLFSNREK